MRERRAHQDGPGRARLRRWIAAGAAFALGSAALLAFAQWLAVGEGTAYSKAGVSLDLTTELATPSPDLVPGTTGALTIRIHNPNRFPVTVTSIEQNGPVVSDDALCDNEGNGVSLSPQTVALALLPESSTTFTVPGAVAMALTASFECESALFSIPVTLNGGAAAPTTTTTAGGPTTTAPSCDDGNPYTIDSYNAGSGSCQHVPLPDGTFCDDGDPDTFGDVIVHGMCKGSVV